MKSESCWRPWPSAMLIGIGVDVQAGGMRYRLPIDVEMTVAY